MEWKGWLSHCNATNERNLRFKIWLSHTDGAVGELIHKQLSQIRYNFKVEHLSYLTMIKSKQSLWNTHEWKSVFELVEEWNCEHWKCFILAHLTCDAPMFTMPLCPISQKLSCFPEIVKLIKFPNFLWWVYFGNFQYYELLYIRFILSSELWNTMIVSGYIWE